MSEISGWDEWNPEAYLNDYYGEVQPDEVATIQFLVERLTQVSGGPKMVEVGSGPTLHHVFPAIPHVSGITMSDYLQGNLEEIQRWIRKDEGRHDWFPFVRYTLQCEGLVEPPISAVLERKRLTREKICEIKLVDVSLDDPLGREHRGGWPLVLSCYCADSATDSQEVWERYMHNIASLVVPGGTFITAALYKAPSYKVGEKFFPSANIDESDLSRVLQLDFDPRSIMIEVREVIGHQSQGYNGVILAQATKKYETYS